MLYFHFNLLLAGGVGKSALVIRYISGKFVGKYVTVHVDILCIYFVNNRYDPTIEDNYVS